VDTDRAWRILIVDEDSFVAQSVAGFLARQGFRVDVVTSAAHALQSLGEAHVPSQTAPADPFAVVLTDLALSDMEGLTFVRALHRDHPAVVPIVLAGYATIETAVKAIRFGALEYLTKPVVDAELLVAIERGVQQHALRRENDVLRHQLDARSGLDNIVGADPRMRRIYDVIDAVAPSRTTVLMCGESGTGKSLIARAIHQQSPRAGRPFVEIACGSIPETLLESELFGHMKGAFTGAHTDKPGRFLAAHEGTIFLDEINSASPGMQLKLLRVLQERAFEPVGTNETVKVDVRVILASNQPLEDLVARGQFRQDLYYRINVVSIHLPPLRDRVADVPHLAEHFLAIKAQEAGRQILGFTPEAIASLKAYDYPGNVRELENIVERAVVLTRSVRIDAEDLPPEIRGRADHRLGERAAALPWVAGDWSPQPLRLALEEPERRILLAALRHFNWNRQKTAEALDINRTTLYKKIKAYRLDEAG